MLKDTLPEIRAEAKRLGIPWAWVLAAKDQLIRDEREHRGYRNGIRMYAWHSCVGADSGSAPFWRHGFQARFAARFARGADFTIIPGYDLIAQEVASQFPEFEGEHAGDVSGCNTLWEFLLSSYEPWPPRETFYWKAIDQLQEQRALATEEELCQTTPF